MMAASRWSHELLRSYAARMRDADPREIEDLSLQLADPSVRPVLAHLATDGRLTFDDLKATFLTSAWSAASRVPADSDHRWLASLARVVVLQNANEGDLALGLAIYRYLHAREHIGSHGAVHAKLFGDLLLVVGGDHELAAIIDADDGSFSVPNRLFLSADLHNPWRGGPFARSVEGWVSDFEAAGQFLTDPPLEVTADGPKPFDCLRSRPGREVVSDALVSVVMPVHRPDGRLWASVKSIVEQSWTDLEIIIVDDGSGPAFRDLLEDVARSDPRIRVVRCRENRGAYAARNTGVLLARGQFVTFQDYDDWSHSRRLERQVAPLLSDPALVATHSRCVRVDESLLFVHPGYRPLRHNASSLMIRRHEVTLGIGYFDEVRKAADSEYHARLVAHFGASAVENLREEPVLAAVRRLEGSLSRSDFRAGWHHPDRVWYRESYTRWHQRASRQDLFIEAGEAARRFPAPRGFVTSEPRPRNFDVVVLADWHVNPLGDGDLVPWIEGFRGNVAVAHLDSLAHTTRLRPPLVAEIVDLAHAGVVEVVGVHDVVQASSVVVVHPSVLQFTATLETAWSVEAVVLAEGIETPTSESAQGLYDPAEVAACARAMFRREPVWKPMNQLVPAGQYA